MNAELTTRDYLTTRLELAEGATNYLEANDAETTLDGSEWTVAHDSEFRFSIAWCSLCNTEAVFSQPNADFIADARTSNPVMAAALLAVLDAIDARDETVRDTSVPGSRVMQEAIENGASKISTADIRRAITDALGADK